jgi:hypothetical protein
MLSNKPIYDLTSQYVLYLFCLSISMLILCRLLMLKKIINIMLFLLSVCFIVFQISFFSLVTCIAAFLLPVLCHQHHN